MLDKSQTLKKLTYVAMKNKMTCSMGKRVKFLELIKILPGNVKLQVNKINCQKILLVGSSYVPVPRSKH